MPAELQIHRQERDVRRNVRVPEALVEFETAIDEETIRGRLAERAEEKSVSDGRWEIYQAQTGAREAIDELQPEAYLRVDAARPLADQIEAVIQHLG